MPRLSPVTLFSVRTLLFGAALLSSPFSRGDDALRGLPPPPAGTLRVCVVRHGQALSNLDPAPALPPDELDHLTPLGLQQAEAAGRALAGRGVTLVLTSPATRARETAGAIARVLGVEAPAVEPRLRPMELGLAPDGRALAWKDRTAEWAAGRDPLPRGGESMEGVGVRVHDLVLELQRSRGGGAVVLVAHGEVLGAWLGQVRGTAAPERHPSGLANGSVTVVDVAADGAAVVVLANHVP
jgi:probable phosphoglycerate mutase